MPPYLSVNINGVKCMKFFIFTKYISHKKEIKVNNLTPYIAYIINNLGFSSILIFWDVVIQCPLTCP